MPFIQNVARRIRTRVGLRPSRRLHVLHDEPFNAETPLGTQTRPLTPIEMFYVRNHGDTPRIARSRWRLSLGGEFEHPLSLSYEQLRALPSHNVVVTLECAGNGRSTMQPPVAGEPWGLGAVSTAAWTGVPLRVVLELAGLTSRARQLVFTGADTCETSGGDRVLFQRALSIEAARDLDVLLAYAMNGEPLPPHHGFPVRLIVPRMYGVASVKWLTRIDAIETSFEGYFQTDRYVIARDGERGELLHAMKVRSVFVSPGEGDVLDVGRHRVMGLAWSGSGLVDRVEVSIDGGEHWSPAMLHEPIGPHAWRRWEFVWEPAGEGSFDLRCRAFDHAGNAQPDGPEWNRFGYANNAVESIVVKVRA